MTVPDLEIVLASSSPRRSQLLAEAGYRFRVVPSSVLEPPPCGFSSPEAYVTHVAWLKATEVAKQEQGLVLAADTACCVGAEVLGKPVDRNDARRILGKLQGTRHRTLTGLCLVFPTECLESSTDGRPAVVDSVATTVWMRQLDDARLEEYLDTNAWDGKAGAYGIQDRDDPFVANIDGSISNVVGLPMERLALLLKAVVSKIGIP